MTKVNDQDILDFWFKETDESKWFEKDENFDEEIRVRFGPVHQRASRGELWGWRETIDGRLAEIIVLDQFSRNMFRDQPQSFLYDGMALILAQEALRTKETNQLTTVQRAFLYMPFMHSEALAIHEIALTLFKEKGMETFYEYEKQHREIIARFGRYPHRNPILNRSSTAKERKFLEEHDGF